MNDLESTPLALASSAAADASPVTGDRPVSWIDEVCQHLLLKSFEPMDRGCLLVRLPGGQTRSFGSGSEGPSAEIHVRNPRFFRRCVAHGDIGFGESYQSGEWDSPDLTAVIGWFCANVDNAPTMSGSQRPAWHLGLLTWANRIRHRWNRNSLKGSKSNIQAHYDLGNSFYSLWLDPTMTYSAALFDYPDQDLASAQTAKYDRLCQQLRLQPGDNVLEIGSGWGGFAEHAVTRYGCRITTITLSEEQARYAARRFEKAGIADRARVELRDYRHVQGQFDAICSIEMLEAVGDEFLETYFSKVNSLLTRQGRFAAQFITCPDQRYAELRRGVDWIQKHIFPGSLLLSMNRIGEVVQQTGSLWLTDMHDLGLDYAETLQQWRNRFNSQLPAVRNQGFDEHFIRSWNYYLAYCEAAFAWRNISVVQATWSRPGVITKP